MVRRLPLVISLSAGLIGLVWGVVALARIFATERDEANAASEGRRLALAAYATSALKERLTAALDAARPRMQEALANPLLPANDLVLLRDGELLLPRPVVYASGDATPAIALLARLRAGTAAAPTGPSRDDPWATRLALYAELDGAVAKGEGVAITRCVRALLAHRARFVLAAPDEVPYLIAFIGRLAADARVDHALMVALLRDGVAAGFERRVTGLQPFLLVHRHRFSEPDFEALVREVEQLSRGAGVEAGDFHDRAAETAPAAPPIPATLSEPALVQRRLFVAPIGGRGYEGVIVAPADIVTDITTEMQRRGLVVAGDELRLSPTTPEAAPLAALSLEVRSPAWEQARAAAGSRYLLKTGLGVLLGTLALAIVALALLLHRREQRYVELKSGFVATVSHELRTPLAAVRVMAETLERRLTGARAAGDFPARIIREVDGLTFMVENILTFNRLEKGSVQAHLADVPLSELVTGLRAEAAMHTSAAVEIELEPAADVLLHVDRDLLHLLLTNLLSNACKYNERRPVVVRITVAAARPLVIHFADNGIGIPEALRDAVFGEFVRGPRAGSTTKGFGLGLAICRRIMSLHGGAITVDDSGPSGTTFALTFPSGAAEPSHP